MMSVSVILPLNFADTGPIFRAMPIAYWFSPVGSTLSQPGMQVLRTAGSFSAVQACCWVMALKIGPVSAKFSGKITLADILPPESYKLSFEGQGGPAGFGKGSAAVKLTPNADGCDLSYTANASVGGKIAQLGQRLIDGAAKSMAEDFFKRFDQEMQRQHPDAYAAKMVMGDVSTEPGDLGTRKIIPVWIWAVGAAVVVIAAYLLMP